MRNAIHDFVPNTNYKTTVMYWANQSTTAAAAMLFKRHKNDLQDYIERYETELKMLEIFGPALRQRTRGANNPNKENVYVETKPRDQNGGKYHRGGTGSDKP
jgi:hypothetical protein